MTHTIGDITFGTIRNVRKFAGEEGVYFADIDICFSEGFPFEASLYCARADDYAPTGKWVYQQIIDGNFEGDLIHVAADCDPVTGLPVENPIQPTVVGAQDL